MAFLFSSNRPPWYSTSGPFSRRPAPGEAISIRLPTRTPNETEHARAFGSWSTWLTDGEPTAESLCRGLRATLGVICYYPVVVSARRIDERPGHPTRRVAGIRRSPPRHPRRERAGEPLRACDTIAGNGSVDGAGRPASSPPGPHGRPEFAPRMPASAAKTTPWARHGNREREGPLLPDACKIAGLEAVGQPMLPAHGGLRAGHPAGRGPSLRDERRREWAAARPSFSLRSAARPWS